WILETRSRMRFLESAVKRRVSKEKTRWNRGFEPSSLVFSPLRAIRRIFSTCHAFAKEVFRHDPMFRHRSATPAGVSGNGGVRSLGDHVTSILGSAVGARADTATASITVVGGQPSGSGQPR